MYLKVLDTSPHIKFGMVIEKIRYCIASIQCTQKFMAYSMDTDLDENRWAFQLKSTSQRHTYQLMYENLMSNYT